MKKQPALNFCQALTNCSTSIHECIACKKNEIVKKVNLNLKT